MKYGLHILIMFTVIYHKLFFIYAKVYFKVSHFRWFTSYFRNPLWSETKIFICKIVKELLRSANWNLPITIVLVSLSLSFTHSHWHIHMYCFKSLFSWLFIYCSRIFWSDIPYVLSLLNTQKYIASQEAFLPFIIYKNVSSSACLTLHGH